MTRKPTRNFSQEIGAASAAILTLRSRAGLRFGINERRNNGGGGYDHLR